MQPLDVSERISLAEEDQGRVHGKEAACVSVGQPQPVEGEITQEVGTILTILVIDESVEVIGDGDLI